MVRQDNVQSAFRLVRQLLAERPRAFQQILKDGVASSSTAASGSSSTSQDASTSSSRTAASNPLSSTSTTSAASGSGRKGKGKSVVPNAGGNIVPDGHPFISASFLKSRILPILASQGLIFKSAAVPNSSHNHSRWQFSLTPSSPIPTWSIEQHWDRLLAGESPAKLAHERQQHFADLPVEQRDQPPKKMKEGSEKRIRKAYERDMMAWEGREEALTMRLERLHLNGRRARARPAKERAALAAEKAFYQASPVVSGTEVGLGA